MKTISCQLSDLYGIKWKWVKVKSLSRVQLFETSWTVTCQSPPSMGIPDHLTCLLINLYAGQEATVRTRHGKRDWFQTEKGVYQGPAYLTYVQSTSWEMQDWKKHKVESRLLGEISITSDMQMTPPLWQKVKVKSLSRVRLLATPWTAALQALCPWDFPGKSTGVGCHCLLRY